MAPHRSASTLTPPPSARLPATEISFSAPFADTQASGPRHAIAQRGWTTAKVAWCLALWDAAGIGLAMGLAFSQGWQMHALCGLSLLLGPVCAYIFGAFAVPKVARPWAPALAAACGGTLAALGVFACAMIHDSLLLAALPLAAVAVWPTLARIVVGRSMRRRVSASRWLIVGTPEVLMRIDAEHQRGALRGEYHYLVIPGPGDVPQQGVVGSVEALGRCLNRRWTGIVITSPEAIGDDAVRDVMHARLRGVRVYDLAEFWEAFLRKVPVLHLGAGWVMLSRGFQLLHSPISLRLKRVSDVVLAGFGVILAAPLMLVTAIMVKATSRGPILFRQERVGARGQRFIVLKFRSMHVGSESGDKYTLTQDPRITRIGRFLRKSRFDELPQLWNILRGDMSFIGPRAEWTRCVEAYESVLPYYHLRHVVKPGLTGWAQVNYPYGASVEDALEKLQYDLWYIKHQSLFLDLRIVLKTVRVVLFGLGR